MSKILVTNHAARLQYLDTGVGLITLIPGVNEVDADLWKIAVRHPVTQFKIQSCEFEVAMSKPVADDAPALAKMSVAKAVTLAGETFDLTLLGKWREEEKREKVIEAIDLQLAMIDEATKPPTQTAE